MSLHQDLLSRLTKVTTERMGFDGALVEQQTPEWFAMRLGVITASRAKDLIATGGLAPFPEDVEIVKDGRQNTAVFAGKTYTGTKAEIVSAIRHALPPLPSDARNTYMLELIAEIATGQHKDHGTFKQTEWGNEYEEMARQIFAFHTGIPVLEIPFVYGDDTLRYGCSPDGIADDTSGIEIKCPFTTPIYLEFLLHGEIKPEYREQTQFQMFSTGAELWHFANYDPRMRVRSFHDVIIERDEARMKTFEDAVGQMVYDMDRALSTLDLRYGDQWSAINHAGQHSTLH